MAFYHVRLSNITNMNTPRALVKFVKCLCYEIAAHGRKLFCSAAESVNNRTSVSMLTA